MKAIMFITVIFILSIGGVMLFHEPSSKAQVPPDSPKVDIEKKFDAQLDRVEDKVSKAEQVKISTKPKIIYLVRKVYVPREDKKKVLLTLDGGEYLIDPVIHKEYLMVDVDSIQKAMADQEIEQAMYSNDTLSQVMIEEANERISLWKKVKSFFKRKK